MRKEGKEGPLDECVGGTGVGCGGTGGPLPEGVLFGGTRPSWGADKELGREPLKVWLRADFGESKGIKEGGWGILVCPRRSAVFALPGGVRRLSVVTSMTLRCNWTLRETSQNVVEEGPHCMLREQQGRKTAQVGRDDGSGGRSDGGGVPSATKRRVPRTSLAIAANINPSLLPSHNSTSIIIDS